MQPKVLRTLPKFSGGAWKALLQHVGLHAQHRYALIDVIMKLSCDPGTFLFLRVNQFLTHARERLLSTFPIRDVDARTYVAGKMEIRTEAWDSCVEHPSICAIVVP